MKVGKYSIENFSSPYIIAEVGSNHNGDMDLAAQLIHAAKNAGCHCVKFQSWSKDTIFSKNVYENNYFLKDDYRNRSDFTLEEIVDKFSISEQELLKMRNLCNELEIDFSSSPFSRREVDVLVKDLEAPFVKVASMDLNNYPFLDYIARQGKPVMLSTGLSTLSEIDRAVQTIENAGNSEIILLHCISICPPSDEMVHLNNIDMLRANYPDYPVGFSDHTIGTAIPLASVAKGACVIEKHFTLDKNMPGWDHKVSATEAEMREIVEGSGRISKALGSYRRVLSDADHEKIPAFRRSLVAARDISAGSIITKEDLDSKRPGTGIEPQYMNMVIGRVAKRDIPFDKVLSPEDF